MSRNGTVVWLSTTGAAKHLGVSRTTLYRLVDDGLVPAYRPGRSLQFKEHELDDYLERTKVKPGELKHLVGHTRRRPKN